MGQDEAAQGYGNGNGNDDESRARRMRMVAIGTAVGLFVLIGGAVAVYAYDSSKNDQIADGVKVGTVDVGGHSREEAKRLLLHDLVEPLQEPVRVKVAGRSFKVRAKALRVRADLDGMVDEAIDASREGGLFGRTFRYITGGTVDSEIEPQVSYSRRAVSRFVNHVVKEVNRPPQDASVSATGASLNVVPAAVGRTLKKEKLLRRVNRVLDTAARYRTVRVGVVRTKPEVTTKEVASEYPSYLTLERAAYTLRLWKDLKLVKSYTVAVGQAGLETPAGLYHLQSKEVDPVWHVPESDWAGSLAGMDIPPGPSNPLKARWMGIFSGAGIHGTDQTYSLGSAVSHGCVRMSIPDVVELYDQVEVGTPIYIG